MVTKCKCGIPVATLTSWTHQNPDRRFEACKFYEPGIERRGCKYFRWLDEKILDWQRDVTNQLLMEKKMKEAEIRLLKHDVKIADGHKRCPLNEIEHWEAKFAPVDAELKSIRRDGRGIGKVVVQGGGFKHGFALGFLCCLCLILAYVVMFWVCYVFGSWNMWCCCWLFVLNGGCNVP